MMMFNGCSWMSMVPWITMVFIWLPVTLSNGSNGSGLQFVGDRAPFGRRCAMLASYGDPIDLPLT